MYDYPTNCCNICYLLNIGGEEMSDKIELTISESLVESAESRLSDAPHTIEEQIEHWARLGRAVSQHLTENEILQVMSGAATVRYVSNESD